MKAALSILIGMMAIGCASTETGFGCARPGHALCEVNYNVESTNVNLFVVRANEDSPSPRQDFEPLLVSVTIEQVLASAQSDSFVVGDTMSLEIHALQGEAYLVAFGGDLVGGAYALGRVAPDESRIFAGSRAAEESASVSLDDALDLLFSDEFADHSACYMELDRVLPVHGDVQCNDTRE